MKHFVAILALSAYLIHLLGYLVVFLIAQQDVRQEMKALIKQQVADDECMIIAITSSELEDVQWKKEHEFRYRGELFDVVRMVNRNDTTYYFCINDVREELLFANLEKEVQRQTGNDATQSKTNKNDISVRDHLSTSNLILFQSRPEPSPHFFLVHQLIPSSSEPATPPPRFL